MRNFLIILTIFISTAVLAQDSAIKDSDLKDGKHGSKNIHTGAGEIVIPFQFGDAHDFSEGLAAVKVGKEGKIVIKPQFEGAKGRALALRTVERLIEKGVDINARDKYGETLLIYVVKMGYTEVVKILIEKGVDINARDRSDWTALMHAVEKRHTEIVEILLENDAYVDIKDGEQIYPDC